MLEDKKKYLFKATNFVDPIIVKGKGSYVWDVENKKYLDLNSGQFCVVLGHNYYRFNKLISDQLKNIHHTNTLTLSQNIIEAAEKVAKINKGNLNKTIFLSTGSEANECAIRYARFITGKSIVVSLDKGYHGLTLASQNATMAGIWARPEVKSLYVKTPDIHNQNYLENSEKAIKECIEELEACIKMNHSEIAAFIVEPIIGVGGMFELPQKYIEKIRELCTKYQIILIFDECQSGYGRTGSWFAYEYFNVIPDIVTTAKAMGMGFPVSAVTFSQEIAEKIEGKITHFSSHQNEPLSAAIVNFVIDEINNKGLLERNIKMGAYLLKELKKISQKYTLLKNPRGLGLMCGFDLNEEMIKERKEIVSSFPKLLEKEGVLIQSIRQGRTFRIMPNYLIKKMEIDFFIEKLEKVLIELSRE